jgi:hypothetical protein
VGRKDAPPDVRQAARGAADALVIMAVLYLALAGVITWAMLLFQPGPETRHVMDAARIGAVVLAGFRLATAYFVRRLYAWAWWLAVVGDGLGLLAVLLQLAAAPGVFTAIPVPLPYWIFKRLFQRTLVGHFTGLSRYNAKRTAVAEPAEDPRFDWVSAAPLPPGGRVLDGYVAAAEPAPAPPPPPAPAPRPATSGGFDYFA